MGGLFIASCLSCGALKTNNNPAPVDEVISCTFLSSFYQVLAYYFAFSSGINLFGINFFAFYLRLTVTKKVAFEWLVISVIMPSFFGL